MLERIRERWTGWGARLSFAALLLVFSEGVVWQRPTEYTAQEWIALGALYLAFAALALDLFVRLRVNEIFSMFLLAGLYGLVNGTLINHVISTDLPLSLLVRPMAAQPLAFIAAFGAFQLLSSGRATGPVDFGIAALAGLVWGVWVRWFPVISDDPVPAAEIGDAILVLLVAGVAVMVLRFLLPPIEIFRRDDWQLLLPEWILMAAIPAGALIYGYAQGQITDPALLALAFLGSFISTLLWATARLRRESSLLDSITPPRRPNPAAWLILLIPFLLAGWIGYSLPGDGDSSIQSDILFGALIGFALMWPPAVSALSGLRAYLQMERRL
jgi:hypothetical protein